MNSPQPLKDMSHLRARRLMAHRRRRLIRVDVGLGVLVALLALLLAPGLAILAVLALLVLVLCALWAAVERVRLRER